MCTKTYQNRWRFGKVIKKTLVQLGETSTKANILKATNCWSYLRQHVADFDVSDELVVCALRQLLGEVVAMGQNATYGPTQHLAQADR